MECHQWPTNSFQQNFLSRRLRRAKSFPKLHSTTEAASIGNSGGGKQRRRADGEDIGQLQLQSQQQIGGGQQRRQQQQQQLLLASIGPNSLRWARKSM
jgi:hypothetical protein